MVVGWVRRIVLLLFCAVYKYSYLLTYLSVGLGWVESDSEFAYGLYCKT